MAITVTYDILVNFGESFISDYVDVSVEAYSLEDIEIETHAQVCVMLLNQYCNMKGKVGELVRFGIAGDVDRDLTAQVKELLVQHK
jgi:hypothetical protein